MEDATNTQIISKTGKVTESSILGVSIRGWMAYLLVFTVCLNQLIVTAVTGILAVIKQDLGLLGSASVITEPLYGLSYMAVGYYFAKMNMPKQ